MIKRGLLFASVLVIGMGMSIPVWAGEASSQTEEASSQTEEALSQAEEASSQMEEASSQAEEAAPQTDEGISGILSSLFSEGGELDKALGALSSRLEDANSTLRQDVEGLIDMLKDEEGSIDWGKADASIKELISLIADGVRFGGKTDETDAEDEELDIDAILAEIMIPYEKADAVMYAYLAERNADLMDAGDAQVFSKKTGYMDDPEEDEVKVLGEFTQVNFAIDGDQMNMVSGATDTLLLTLTKGEDGTYTVTDEKQAADGSDYEASLKELCDEVGIEVDDFYASTIWGACNDADALAEYLDEHPEIASAEFQGEQKTAEELHAIATEYSDDLMDSIFGEDE